MFLLTEHTIYLVNISRIMDWKITKNEKWHLYNASKKSASIFDIYG